MIRAVLAVVLALALLSASLPAVDAARADRSTASVRADLSAVETAARSLVTGEDATLTDVPGARKRAVVHVPSATWSTARVAWVGAGGRPDGPGNRSRLAFRVAGAGVETVRLRGLRVRTPGGPVVFRDPGRHALTLSLRRDDGPVVVLRRARRR